jgi:uncharacterized iron-regulated membrane protein
MFRKLLFWSHLIAGLATGIVVFMMSLTGVILTYERQWRAAVAEGRYLPAEQQGVPLPLEQLLSKAGELQAGQPYTTLVITNHPGAPVEFRSGRRAGATLNPYSGDPLPVRSESLERFLSAVTGWHRWFNVGGEGRAAARQITGVSNAVFLFLILSGLYLWLPPLVQSATLRARLWFRSDYPSSKSRDFHWHHIFGIWAALPLLAVVYTGMVISYPWAATALYRVFGAELPVAESAAPVAGGAPGATATTLLPPRDPAAAVLGSPIHTVAGPQPPLALASLVERAVAHAQGDWQRLQITLPAPADSLVRIEIDRGNGAQAHKRYTLGLERSSGAVVDVRTSADTPATQRLRGIARYLHTGEVLGFFGQTVAGLVSLAALFMVWTGFALSWRRLIQPLLGRRR